MFKLACFYFPRLSLVFAFVLLLLGQFDTFVCLDDGTFLLLFCFVYGYDEDAKGCNLVEIPGCIS